MSEPNRNELREAALIQYTHDYWINDEAEIHFNNGFDAGYEAGKPKWIPVGERLPDIEGWYSVYGLVYLNVPPIVTTALYENGRWSAAGEPAYILVVAWQPLPEPYTEGE